MIIAWEVTSACNLACDYCRASATPSPAADELSTAEALSFIDEVAPLSPMFILSGGEPLLRLDIFELASRISGHGLRVSLATNGTLVTPEAVDSMVIAGIERVSVSLDGLEAEHEARRGKGSFASALAGMDLMRDRLDFQINMTVTRRNYGQVEAIMDLAEEVGASAMHIFFLVPTGRARVGEMVSPKVQGELLSRICIEQSRRIIEIQVTCAPQYARVLKEAGMRPRRGSGGCLAGVGFVFLSSIGEVYPCGYLPVRAGSIREESFASIWKSSPVFERLRHSDLTGRCGECDYGRICRGCRARAYAVNGDILGEDPLCPYNI